MGAALSLIALVATLADPTYRPDACDVAIWLLISLARFGFYSRKRLVANAPEEEIAHGQEGRSRPRPHMRILCDFPPTSEADRTPSEASMT